MMSMAGNKPAGAHPDPLSTIVLVVSIEAEANSSGAETKLAVGSVDTEMVADTSGIVIVVAFAATRAATKSTSLGSPPKI